MPDLPTQQFVLYGDQHEPSAADAPQLEALTQVLLKHDQESDEKIHILMEKPAGTPFYTSILGNLHERLQGCRTISVENIEMRCTTGAACTLLDPKSPPCPLSAERYYDSAYAVCNLRDLTMGEVEHEISLYNGMIGSWRKTLQPQYEQAIRLWDPELQVYIDEFNATCSKLSVTASTKIKELSDRLYDKEPRLRLFLYKAIHNIASVLFDMHICKCITALKHPDIILLVTGAQHAYSAHDFLTTIGNRAFPRYGLGQEFSLHPTPLSIRQLDLDQSYLNLLAACPVQ
jgi:hypothetical protein